MELRRAKRASRAPWVRFFGKSIHARNFGYEVMYVRPPVETVGVEAGHPLGTGVFGQFSLEGNRVPALRLATRVFLVGNHISDEQQERAREKRRRNLRNLSKKSSRESEEGEEKKISMKPNVKLREIERGKTLIYDG